jgi:3-deoxy-manno-octulosonate cytidylyltransferase (CMP-KDO synthetase)
MHIVCVIPARFASQRLPGKPMLMIDKAPMIEWVYKRACKVKLFDDVIVATDNQTIFNHIVSIGGRAAMTPEDLRSGTDRVAYVAKDLNADIFLNLQGDEPLITPGVLEKVCSAFNDPEVQIATPVTKIKTLADLIDPNSVRVVLDHKGNALFFTRSVIPYFRDLNKQEDWLVNFEYYKHIGIYAYRKDFLLRLTSLQPGKLEKVENLEQLRVLEYGYKIRAVISEYQSRSIDTKEDLIEMNKYITDNHINLDEVDAKM